jgi:hypothetical protein
MPQESKTVVDMDRRVVWHDVWPFPLPDHIQRPINEMMDFIVSRFGGSWRSGTAVGQQSVCVFYYFAPSGIEGDWSLDFFEPWVSGADKREAVNTVLSRMFYMLVGVAEEDGFMEHAHKCGFIPPTPGYSGCTREKGHTGPCAHPLESLPGQKSLLNEEP